MIEAGMPADRRTSSLKRSERLALIDALTAYPLPWSGNEGYKKAEVTGGGVALDEVDPKTLESKRVPGLYLCGEMLDAFGPIGGHNFAWAWATGRARLRRMAAAGRANDLDARSVRAWLAVGLLLFSGWSVYTRYVDLHASISSRSMPFRDLSMSQYNDTLAGVRKFPVSVARARLLDGERAGTMIAPVDPHVIDVAVKTLSLAASAALLYMFSTTLVSALGAVLAAVMYLFVTAAAFGSEGYAIYFTNDYLAILSWFAGVVALRRATGGSRRSRRSRARGRRKRRC